MFRKMRRFKQQLPQDEAYRIIDNATSGVLCVQGDNGYPYGVPLSHVRQDNTIYFHSALSGHKVDAITACDKASFTVIAGDDVKPTEYTTYFRSAIAFGRVRIVQDTNEKAASLRLLGNRFNPGHPSDTENEAIGGIERLHMIAFEIEHITAKEARELAKARHEAESQD